MSENSTRQQVKEITDRLEAGMSELFTSDKYAEYLRTMSRFHKYSTRNTLLIHMQKPDASLVAGYQAWQSKFGRFVKKGEKAIKILAPTPYLMKQEEMKLDPDTKLPVLDGKTRSAGTNSRGLTTNASTAPGPVNTTAATSTFPASARTSACARTN